MRLHGRFCRSQPKQNHSKPHNTAAGVSVQLKVVTPLMKVRYQDVFDRLIISFRNALSALKKERLAGSTYYDDMDKMICLKLR